ncbi:hypothetical protein [Methylovulum psychrotolerans]|uniref:Uncharacterized protein n=1 Tax=Methylovulum psychrotolerans TaxID=1704499 RepID=A0A1Z4BXA8_9GAMM|nr:hypothetical protein [Methylovulum psychrotolerans]ASF45889.1 hypothetical protein CEK71_07260 [Methylovulum psychrotolerans]MBT9097805.1 hypothetical protein [Methylovulum psychrotolerans]POZ53354.1 hypothetical protein AADEFJLK_00374 [Methylovulum psychrotolerans]
MLKEAVSWVLFALLFIEGIYLNVLLVRTDYASHATTIGCDALLMMYALCLMTLTIASALFFKTKPISYFYLIFMVLSCFMLGVFSLMNVTQIFIGIGGDDIEGSWMHFFCPHGFK